MHSLKNTVIAVGLLGLSFLFYQASSNNSPITDDMIPALEIADGSDGLDQSDSAGDVSAIARLGSIEPIEMPKVDISSSTSSQTAESNASFGGNSPSKAPLITNDKNKFTDFGYPASDSSKSGLSAGNEFGGDSNGFTAKANNATQPNDSVARDDGLIDALNSQQMSTQNQFAPTKPPTTNDSETQPISTGAAPFKSQPIPASDSSFSAMATDSSKKSGSDVMHANADPDPATLSLQSAWPHIDQLVSENKYLDAHRLLSSFYRSNDLSGPQRQRLIGWLDALAGKVIFSAEHHIDMIPYTVMDESLADIGKQWKVTPQLIYNINETKIPNPEALPGGTELKVVKGPFNAEIDTRTNIMTLFLGDLYAGRFPVRLGVSGSPKPGTYRVLVKSEMGHEWRDALGNTYPPGSPENGYGPHWIGLAGSLCIHEVDDSVEAGHRGCIGLNAKDAKDVFTILTNGSNVKIIR